MDSIGLPVLLASWSLEQHLFSRSTQFHRKLRLTSKKVPKQEIETVSLKTLDFIIRGIKL
jgi:hypothetical protein